MRFHNDKQNNLGYIKLQALGGLVVSVLATGPLGLVVPGSGPAEDAGYL
jgi:hypothetical protein